MVYVKDYDFNKYNDEDLRYFLVSVKHLVDGGFKTHYISRYIISLNRYSEKYEKYLPLLKKFIKSQNIEKENIDKKLWKVYGFN